MTIEERKRKKEILATPTRKWPNYPGYPWEPFRRSSPASPRAPRYATLQALEKAFRPAPTMDCSADDRSAEDRTTDHCTYPAFEEADSAFHESAAPYHVKKQGEYTLEDYYALPDDQRAELIDGVLYDMSAPTYPHQIIQLEIGYQLTSYIDANHGSCMPFIAPARRAAGL